MRHHERLGTVLVVVGTAMFVAGMGSETYVLAVPGILIAGVGSLMVRRRWHPWSRLRFEASERRAELDAALLRYEGTFEAVPLLPDRDPELVRNARVRRMQIAAKLCAADPSLVSAAAIARFHGIEQKECRPQVWAMLSPRDAPEALLAFIDAWTRDPQHPL